MILFSIGSEVELVLWFFSPEGLLSRELGPKYMRLLNRRGKVFIIPLRRFLVLLLCLLLLLFIEFCLQIHVVFHILTFLFFLLPPLLLHLDPQLFLIIHLLVGLALRLLGVDREESSSETVIAAD